MTDTTATVKRAMPGEQAPSLRVDLVGGGHWDLQDSHPATLTVIVFYRGRFCNVCSRYLPSIQAQAGALAERGTDVVLVSADNESQAVAAKEDWGLTDLPVGYGLKPSDMAAWGLFMSEADPGRPMAPVLCEPGFFLVTPDKTIFYAALNSAPFGRPTINEILEALDFIAQREGGYPQRGGFVLEEAGRAY
jgi:peroxiredoxin